MRRVYCAVLLVLFLAACSMHAGESSYPGGRPVAATPEATEPATVATEPPTAPTTRPTEPETEETDPETEPTEPATEATAAATEPTTESATTATQPVVVGDLARGTILFRVVDGSGAPVPNLAGTLELEADGIAYAKPLTGDGGQPMSGENGFLYATGVQSSDVGLSYRLLLHSYYGGEPSLILDQPEPLPQSPDELTVTWTKGLPPPALPAQAAGMRIFMQDADGKPVPGVILTGSPYPRETEGPIPEIAMQLGPSDADGVIRWDNVKPGTYALIGHKDGRSTSFTFVMPAGQALVDMWAVFG